MADYRDATNIDPNLKYQIDQIPKFIREKMYGVDVREAIAQGIERTYEDASKNGNANMEVSAARGSYPVLKDRLNAMDSKSAELQSKKADQSFVDAQLSSIVSGAPKGTYPNLTALKAAYPSGTDGVFLVLETGHWYYWNGDSKDWLDGGVYQATSISERSIEPDQLTIPLLLGAYGERTVINRDSNGNVSEIGEKRDGENFIFHQLVRDEEENVTKIVSTTQGYSLVTHLNRMDGNLVSVDYELERNE